MVIWSLRRACVCCCVCQQQMEKRKKEREELTACGLVRAMQSAVKSVACVDGIVSLWQQAPVLQVLPLSLVCFHPLPHCLAAEAVTCTHSSWSSSGCMPCSALLFLCCTINAGQSAAGWLMLPLSTYVLCVCVCVVCLHSASPVACMLSSSWPAPLQCPQWSSILLLARSPFAGTVLLCRVS